MTGTENIVKHVSATGGMIKGVHLTFPAPVIIEVLGRSNKLQFIYLDGEHGRFDWQDIEIACITAERCHVTPIARVFDTNPSTITRFLDRGVLGIVAPHIETVEDAKRVIDAAYFAPLGNRSFGSGRPEYGTEIGDRRAYIEAVNSRISVCLMIESRRGVENIESLAALPGVDYFSFGLMDLAQDYGHAGDPGHPEVQAGYRSAANRVRAVGKRVREDFMTFAWINDLLIAGAEQTLESDVRVEGEETHSPAEKGAGPSRSRVGGKRLPDGRGLGGG